jgi:hypothetical protein
MQENSDIRKLSWEEYQQLYQQIGSKSLELQSEIMRELTDNQLDLFFKSSDYVYKIVTSIGLIAGFGFTASGIIKDMLRFSFGEAFLISAIAYGLFLIPKIYNEEMTSLEFSSKKYRDIFNKRNTDLTTVVNGYIRDETVRLSDVQRVLDWDSKLLAEFGEADKRSFTNPFITPQKILISLLVLGSVLVLSSFFNMALVCKI